MSALSFLENPRHAFTIAKVAIVAQSFFTVVISLLLIEKLFRLRYFVSTLHMFLLLDCAFVVIHLTYRALYRGTKIQLEKDAKRLLLGHVITSLLALGITFLIVQKNLSALYVLIALVSWCVSLVLGVMFYSKKYKREPSVGLLT